MNVPEINRAALALYLADQPTDRRHPEQLAREWRDGRVTEVVKARYRARVIAAVDAIDQAHIGTDRDAMLARAEARAQARADDIIRAAEALAEDTVAKANATVADVEALRTRLGRDLDDTRAALSQALADGESWRNQLDAADRYSTSLVGQLDRCMDELRIAREAADRAARDAKAQPAYEPAIRRSGVRWYLAAGGTAICEAPAFAPAGARPMFVEVQR